MFRYLHLRLFNRYSNDVPMYTYIYINVNTAQNNMHPMQLFIVVLVCTYEITFQ